MKRLYARLVLWLIAPALAERERRQREASSAASAALRDRIDRQLKAVIQREVGPGGVLHRHCRQPATARPTPP